MPSRSPSTDACPQTESKTNTISYTEFLTDPGVGNYVTDNPSNLGCLYYLSSLKGRGFVNWCFAGFGLRADSVG